MHKMFLIHYKQCNNAMLRVSKEGPKAGTNKALDISEKALDMWPSGERFTTRNWIPGMISKPVKKVFESE